MQPLDPTSAIELDADGASVESRHSVDETWVLFTVDDQMYALDLWQVERVVHAVEITPLPEVPAHVVGVVDVHGQVLPVVDLRVRFDRPPRQPALSDYFIIARTPTHTVVLPVDTASGYRRIPAGAVPPDTELPRCVRKVVPLESGVVYALDLQRVLFGDQPPYDTYLARLLSELQRT